MEPQPYKFISPQRINKHLKNNIISIMVTNYQHHLYPKQSEFVKYRGKTGQIDVRDTIITILAKKPGLTQAELTDHIYEPSLRKSRFYNVIRAIESLEAEGLLVREEESNQFYLHSDAISHDIGKAQSIMHILTEKGLSREQVTFLSSGIIMAGEQARAEHEGQNYHVSETVASFAAKVPEPEVKEEPVPEITNEVVEEIKVIPDVVIEQTEELTVADPFEKMTEEDKNNLKVEVIQQMVEEQEAEKQEAARLQMEAEEAAAEKARIAEAERKEKEELDKLLAYKNKLSSIKTATSLLGLDVDIAMPDLKGQVVGTILELKTDGVLFLIVFSRDDKYLEGTVHTLFYKDNLSYRIMA
jgi:hypothetical protein